MKRLALISKTAVKTSFSLGLLVALSGCATQEKRTPVAPPSNNTEVQVTERYQAFIDQYSAGDVEYAGLYNNFEYRATLLNSDIRKGLVLKEAFYYQWSDAQTSEAREKGIQEMSSQTKIFMAFFTPNPKNDNLADTTKAIWRVYLDSNGRRYEGKVVRVRLLLAEMQALYPYMTRWATPYEITFDVPTAAIEKSKCSFTVTGPLGARTVDFEALNSPQP